MRKGFFRTAASAVVAGLFGLLMMVSAAEATVAVRIDISSQTMSVSVNGWHYASWRVSTARRGYWTPRGAFRPYMLKRMHYSRKYDNSPMPHSIFFYHGYAIHGTNDIRRLGGPASHGCVRLHPSHAATLYALVQRNGSRGTRIQIN